MASKVSMRLSTSAVQAGRRASSPSDLGSVGEQIGRSGPFFTAFLPHSRALAAAHAAKTVLAGADFRFRRCLSPTGCQGLRGRLVSRVRRDCPDRSDRQGCIAAAAGRNPASGYARQERGKHPQPARQHRARHGHGAAHVALPLVAPAQRLAGAGALAGQHHAQRARLGRAADAAAVARGTQLRFERRLRMQVDHLPGRWHRAAGCSSAQSTASDSRSMPPRSRLQVDIPAGGARTGWFAATALRARFPQ